MNSIVYSCLYLFLIFGCVASLPACNTNTCTKHSDCPTFAGVGQFAQCINGACVNGYSEPTQKLGESCNPAAGQNCLVGVCSRTTQRCETPISNECSCTANEQCEGGLCLNGVCDSIRSIGDSCSSDLQCGSVCTNNNCAKGNNGDKCKSHASCSSGYCEVSTFTCQAETRQECSASQPLGYCPAGTSCYNGKCLGHTGAEGSACDSSLGAVPQCKVTLACVNNVCSKVAEGTPCNDHSSCSPVQECSCTSTTGQLGCRTKMGADCAPLYQNLADCLSQCTETGSINTPNTCASKCLAQKQAFDCCVGCDRGSMTPGASLLNVKGSCPSNLQRVKCCTATQLCSTNSVNQTCAAYLPQATSSASSLTLSLVVLSLALFLL